MDININDTNTILFNSINNKLNSLKDMKGLNNQDSDEKLKKAAQDFEAVFIKQFMEILDSTVTKGEFMHGGKAEETFRSMLNEEISKNIASNPASTFGLAKQIYEQMKDKV